MGRGDNGRPRRMMPTTLGRIRGRHPLAAAFVLGVFAIVFGWSFWTLMAITTPVAVAVLIGDLARERRSTGRGPR